MSQTLFALQSTNASHPMQGRRRLDYEALLLTELNPHGVVDHTGSMHAPIELESFGSVREPCPKCQKTSLHLILRQSNVRVAHLLCVVCHSCYDAHYPDGMPALTI